MINPRERIHHYRRELGLTTEEDFDPPGKIHELHAHQKTILYTIAGSLTLEREGVEQVVLQPGDEVVVEEGQAHSGVVGDQGWKYIAAWNPEEAVKFAGLEH